MINKDMGTANVTKLFVIGNGFDCYLHGFPTKYNDFKQYLEKKYPNCEIDFDGILLPTQMPDGELRYDEDELVGSIIRMLDFTAGKDWCELEGCLGEAFIHGIFGENEWQFGPIDFEGDDDESYKTVIDNENMSHNLMGAFRAVRELFIDWVHNQLPNLEYSKAAPKSTPNMENSLFLNFNYTSTLELVYGIPAERICHIHGNCLDKNSKIYFGHGNEKEVDVESRYWGIKDAFDRLQIELKKDTGRAIFDNSEFFSGLRDITDIYSYGFSFSDVDMVYIDEISKIVDVPNVTWHFNNYDWDENPCYIKKVQKYGYKVCKESVWQKSKTNG